MRTTILIAALCAAGLLAGCSTPPKPPAVQESTRRPANDPAVIELLRAQAEIQRARVELANQTRTATAQRMLTEAQALGLQPVMVRARLGAAPGDAATTIYTLNFATGSTRLVLTPAAQRLLVGVAKDAALVELRGRTDALRDNPVDAAIARQRALAAQALLLQQGVPGERIRTTWQSFGDNIAPNDTAAGRAQNRRVEVWVHRVAPEPGVLEERATLAQQQ